MRSLRLLPAAAGLTLACAIFVPALAQDSMGGFDRAYTNRSNNFGHGLWGNGRGTALPVPDRGTDFGFYYGQPYDGGATLFGTGFWTAEYMARRGERGGRGGRDTIDDNDFRGPLGDNFASTEGGKDGWDDGKDGGKPPKDGHGKPPKGDHGHKPPPEKPPHKPPHEHKPPKEVVRYVPYGRTQFVLVPRRSTEVVIIEQKKTVELGEIRVTEHKRRETFSAICLDGKGNEHPAILSTDDGGGDAYAGEIFRCEGDQMLRVSYATGAVEIIGSVRTADGTSYKDCDGGDALVRTSDGELACAVKRPMSRQAERALARSSGSYEAEVAYDDGYDYAAGGDIVDLTGLELTGGVGN